MQDKRLRSVDQVLYTGIRKRYKGKSIREILEEHRAWVRSDGNQGARAMLKSCGLSMIDLSRWNLKGADLNGAFLNRSRLRKLMEANLWHARLREADLKGADLLRGELVCANMSLANLRGANLIQANLRGANLAGTDLSGANMMEALLQDTNLAGADLTSAWFSETFIGNCDLSSVTGLETVRHFGPSSIGLDTIVKSKGRIPELFLKGAGVPDIWITYAKSLVNNPIEFYSCFISHSHEDQDFCERLYADLQTKSVRCWYFPEDATWGKSVWGEIDRSIRVYDKLVVVCSEHSLKSPAVIREIERALQREDREKNEILFPIRIDDYLFNTWDHPHKADVIAKVVGDFREWKDHDKHKQNFDKLLKALNRQDTHRR